MSFLFADPIAGFRAATSLSSEAAFGRQEPLPADVVFAFLDGMLLVAPNDPAPLTLARLSDANVTFDRVTPVGTLDGIACFAALAQGPVPEGLAARPIRKLFGSLELKALAIAALASQLAHFRATHRFCGACGQELEVSPKERALRCGRCAAVRYPTIAPCAIVLIHDERRVVLTRAPHFPKGVYGLVAGFLEPGESLEACVSREVMEETGLSVTDVRYVASQPWPFPSQLMVGFTARYAGGEIVMDATELEEAAWFDVDALPGLPPPLSIARHLIDLHLARL